MVTKTDAQILIKCTQDIFTFVKYVWIIHPIRGKVIFDLYPFQKTVLWNFLNNRFVIVLKARQMGLTELIALYVLWLTLFHPYKNVLIISLKDRVAKKVLRRIKFMYMNLPEILKTPIINGVSGDMGTASEIIFNNGSSIVSVPTTEDAGRSEALSLLIMDEAAIMQFADTIWASAFPTLATGGSAIINSTPFGLGGFYYQTWSESLFKANGFVPLKIRWDLHPERDLEWYHNMRRALGAKRTAQEIDCDFLTSGDNVFDMEDIRAIEDDIADTPVLEKRLNGNLLIFRKPVKEGIYYIGADISTGRASDYSAFTVMDSYGNEMAAFKGRVPPNRLRDILISVGKEYNYALLAPEGDGIGEAVVSSLQESGYPNIYYTERLVKEKGESRPRILKVPGWYTTGKNRPLIINILEQDIRENNITILDPFFTNEAYTFIYDERNRPVAMNKGEYIGDGSETYADDSIIAKAITNYIRKGRQSGYENIAPQ